MRIVVALLCGNLGILRASEGDEAGHDGRPKNSPIGSLSTVEHPPTPLDFGGNLCGLLPVMAISISLLSKLTAC